MRHYIWDLIQGIFNAFIAIVLMDGCVNNPLHKGLGILIICWFFGIANALFGLIHIFKFSEGVAKAQ